jgi:hypothetical protein
MIDHISPEEVIAFLETVKKRRRQWYQEEIFSQDLMPAKVNEYRNHQVIDLNAIDDTIAIVNYFNQQDYEKRRNERKEISEART